MKDLKIVFEVNERGCITPCPNKVNATVGSVICAKCNFYRGINKLKTIVYCKFNRGHNESFNQTLHNIKLEW